MESHRSPNNIKEPVISKLVWYTLIMIRVPGIKEHEGEFLGGIWVGENLNPHGLDLKEVKFGLGFRVWISFGT